MSPRSITAPNAAATPAPPPLPASRQRARVQPVRPLVLQRPEGEVRDEVIEEGRIPHRQPHSWPHFGLGLALHGRADGRLHLVPEPDEGERRVRGVLRSTPSKSKSRICRTPMRANDSATILPAPTTPTRSPMSLDCASFPQDETLRMSSGRPSTSPMVSGA